MLNSMLVKFESDLISRGVSEEKIKSSVRNFTNWTKDELIDYEELEMGAGLSSFFSIDNRIQRLQEHYIDKPADCPVSEWPIFRVQDSVNLGDYGRTSLHNAVIDGNAKLVKLLLDSGEHIKDQDNGGNTAFELAVLEDKDEIVGIFLDRGISS
jgi:hypothetical protein